MTIEEHYIDNFTLVFWYLVIGTFSEAYNKKLDGSRLDIDSC